MIEKRRPIPRRATALATTCACLMLLVGTGHATEIPWWEEPFELNDPILQEHLRAHGVWVSQNSVDCDGATCTLDLFPYFDLGNDPTKPLCPDLEVHGRPHGSGFWGGVLVAEDLFLTVHAAGAGFCNNRYVVFGLAAADAASPLLEPLAHGQTLSFQVPASDVYECDAILAGGATGGWTLARLTAAVPDRRPVKLLRSGSFEPGAVTVTAGYPDRQALKVELSELRRSHESGGSNFAHVLGGSSGSMVLGPSYRALGVACCGDTFEWWFDDGGCQRPDPIFPAVASFDRPIGLTLSLVPAIGLDVSHPEDVFDNPLLIDHYGPPGGPFSDGTTLHRMTAGLAGTEVEWRLDMPGAPWFFAPDLAASAGRLDPGEQLDFLVSPTLNAYNAPVGVYSSWIGFRDVTYGTLDSEVHQLFVGVDSFDFHCVDTGGPPGCDDDFLGAGPSGAVQGESKAYTLRSRWATTQTVTISAPPWLSFSVTGATVIDDFTFDLAAGAIAEVTATVTATGSVGTFEGPLVFESTAGGETMHSVELLARGDLGRLVVDAEPDLNFAPGTVTEIVTALRIPDIPVLDVDFCLQVSITNPFPGGGATPAPTLRLRPPAGAEVELGTLWGKHCFSEELFSPPPAGSVIEVDDLERFEGQSVSGPWTLIIIAPTGKDAEEGTLVSTSWRWAIDP